MEPCLDQATLDSLKPITVNHHNSLLYDSLRQCMANNDELRKALLESAETIEKQIKLIEYLYEKCDAGRSFKYYA